MNPSDGRASDILKAEWEEFERYFAGIHEFNPSMEVEVAGKTLERLRTTQGSETHTTEKEWTLWRASTGAGQRPIFIQVLPNQTLSPGDQALYLKPMDIIDSSDSEKVLKGFLNPPKFSEEMGFHKICKSLSVSLKVQLKPGVYEAKTREQLCHELTQRHISEGNTVFYTLETPVSMEELQKGGDIDGIVNLGLMDNCLKDDDLAYLYRAKLPLPDPTKIRPQDWMKFMDHALIVTTTKSGKTSFAQIVGLSVDNPSLAGLLGWSDTKRRYHGVLCDRIESIQVEEVQERRKEEEATRGLLSFLEQGLVINPRGQGNVTRGYCPVTFAGNPIGGQPNDAYTELDHLVTAETAITRTTNNPRAFGSRMGMFVFDPKAQSVRENYLPRHVRERAGKVLKTIRMGLAPYFTDTFLNEKVQSWLCKPHDSAYRKQILNVAEVVGSPVLSEFTAGLAENYRHFRGFALKLAWMDYVPDVIAMWPEVKVDLDKLIKLMDTHYQRLKSLQLKYLSILRQTTEQEKFIDEGYKLKLISEKPDYLKYLIRTVFIWAKENLDDLKSSETKRVPIDVLNLYWSDVKDTSGYYVSFKRMVKPIKERPELVNQRLMSYGFRVEEYRDECVLKLCDEGIVEKLLGSEPFMEVVKEGDPPTPSPIEGGYQSNQSHQSDDGNDEGDVGDIERKGGRGRDKLCQDEQHNLVCNALKEGKTYDEQTSIVLNGGLSKQKFAKWIEHLKESGDIVDDTGKGKWRWMSK